MYRLSFSLLLICSLLAGCAPGFKPPKLDVQVSGPCRVSLDTDQDGKIDRITTYTYDPSGRVVEESLDDSGDGIVNVVTMIQYTAGGQVSLREFFNPESGQKYGQVLHRYDGRGLPVEEVVDDPLGAEIELHTFYEYDGSGHKIRENYFRDGGVPNGWRAFEYDNSGLVVKEMSDYDGDGRANWTRQYTYNPQGLLSEVMVEDAEGELEQLELYKYDERGFRISKDVDYDADGLFERKMTYLVDEYGNTYGIEDSLNEQLISTQRDYYDYSCWK